MSLVAAKDQTIAIQQEEIEFLRRQSEESERRHAAEIERRDVLLREALGRIPQLPSGLSSNQTNESRTEPPTASPQPPGSTEPAKMSTESLQSSRSWWRRLLGM